jgi:hypothetical protein
MARLKRIGVLFSAILVGIMMCFMGLIAGILYAFGGFFLELFTGTLNEGTVLAFVALIGMPVIFGLFGLVAGAVGAVLYNLTARRFGGIEADFEQEG